MHTGTGMCEAERLPTTTAASASVWRGLTLALTLRAASLSRPGCLAHAQWSLRCDPWPLASSGWARQSIMALILSAQALGRSCLSVQREEGWGGGYGEVEGGKGRWGGGGGWGGWWGGLCVAVGTLLKGNHVNLAGTAQTKTRRWSWQGRRSQQKALEGCVALVWTASGNMYI